MDIMLMESAIITCLIKVSFLTSFPITPRVIFFILT